MIERLLNLLCFCGVVVLGTVCIFIVLMGIYTIIYTIKAVKKELKK